MKKIPTEIYSASQVRQIEQSAFDSGADGIDLMNRAGLAAYRLLRQRWPNKKTVNIYCGPGNNGGDGYVVGQLALQDGLNVVCVASKPPRTELAKQARQNYVDDGGKTVKQVDVLDSNDVIIVDALFGIGLSNDVREPYHSQISAINQCRLPVLAIDIPSGIHADSGQALGCAIRADCTLSFIGLKAGNLLAAGQCHNGALFVDHLGLSPQHTANITPEMQRINQAMVSAQLPQRSLDQHKGQCGRVFILGGQQGMIGAVSLACTAAYRSGCGLVQAAFVGHAAEIWHNYSYPLAPEVITLSGDRDALDQALAQADVIAAGPGMGTGIQSQHYLARVLEQTKPLVMDADALTILANDRGHRDHWVLTPHPGEAARLLQTTTEDIQANRQGAAEALSQQFGGVIVLKGARTLVASEDHAMHICTGGHSGMASAGMGDILTGMIASLIGQGMDLFEASCVAVWCHARAAERWRQQHGTHGIMASDISQQLPDLLNGLVVCRP